MTATADQGALLELAERVENATGPDRSYDVAIFQALGGPVPFQFANKIVALTFDEAEQCYFAPIGDMRVRYEPPTYTASIDAAMSLVPEGWGYSVLDRRAVLPGCKVNAQCFTQFTQHGEAATPALALCAAALRARAQKGSA
jgi:hypothetical protein